MLTEILLAVALIAALVLVVAGVATWSTGAALIVAGIGVAGLGFLFLAEVS